MENFTKLLEAALKTVILVFEVLKRALEDLSKEVIESGHEPVVEGRIAEGSAEGLDVFLAKLFERPVVSGEGANSERPEQGVSFQLFPPHVGSARLREQARAAGCSGNVFTNRSSITESGGRLIPSSHQIVRS